MQVANVVLSAFSTNVASGITAGLAVTPPTLTVEWTHLIYFICSGKEIQGSLWVWGGLSIAVRTHVLWHWQTRICPAAHKVSKRRLGDLKVLLVDHPCVKGRCCQSQAKPGGSNLGFEEATMADSGLSLLLLLILLHTTFSHHTLVSVFLINCL